MCVCVCKGKKHTPRCSTSLISSYFLSTFCLFLILSKSKSTYNMKRKEYLVFRVYSLRTQIETIWDMIYNTKK